MSADERGTPHDARADAPPDATPEALPEGREPPPPGHRAMAVVRWLLVVAMGALAVASVVHGCELRPRGAATSAVVFACPMHPAVVQDHPGSCPICGMDLVARAGAPSAGAPGGASSTGGAATGHAGHRHVASDPYACPMDPLETGLSSDARCPVCKMRLEPRAADAGVPSAAVGSEVPGLALVELSLDRVQLIGMKVARATREALSPTLETVGTVVAPEGGVVKVTTRYGGFVERVVAAETGRKVRRGEPLAIVYSPAVHLAEQEFLTARSLGAGGVGVDLTSDARRRLELLGLGAADLASLEQSGKPHRALTVVAPAGGWIVAKSAVTGLSFQAGAELFTLADLSKVWLLADVYERDLSRVKAGQRAIATFSALPDRPATGEVKLVVPSVDPSTRTAKVRIELDNADLALKPGMYASVTLALPPSSGVVLPREAVVDTGATQYAFVDKGAGRFEPRRVTVGVRVGEKVEVRSGIAEGEVVVTTGNFLLDSESRLRAALEGAAR